MSKLKILLTILFLTISFGIVQAQDNFDDDNQPPEEKPERPNLLRELGLTQEQIREIRTVNQANRQDLRAAQAKVGEARRNLDQAIYSENADEATVKQKLKDFQDAQAEIARIRALTEFSIRKILTPEQLVRFRELRQQFEQMRRERRQNQNPLRMRQMRRNQRRNNDRQQPPPRNQ
jgi:Spy/CpxP family protein refolding chaperone